jgi:hypothetical protein
MNNALLRDPGVEDTFKRKWSEWKRIANKCPSLTHWWVCAVKPKIGKLLRWLGAERKRDQHLVENFYYDAIYALLDADKDSRDKMLQMQRLKAKILRLKSAHYKSKQLDVGANDDYRDEQSCLYQLIKTRKRQRQRTIISLLNADGSMGRTTKELLGACYDY